MIRRNFWQSLKKFCTWGSEKPSVVENFKVASYPANQNSTLRKKLTVPFMKCKRLKLKLRAFLAGYSVAMVTYCVRKIVPICSPVIGHFFDTMIVTSIDKEW